MAMARNQQKYRRKKINEENGGGSSKISHGEISGQQCVMLIMAAWRG